MSESVVANQVADQTVLASQEVVVDARGLPYRELNEHLRNLVAQGARSIVIRNVLGQRYIGTNLRQPVHVRIEGVPGNDLGAFMDGPTIEVIGNAQDGCGNTMNNGALVVHGSAGDIIGHSMRGGKIFVRDNVGYRVGIHMKEYEDVRPVIVIGGTAQHFLGEYMAGGVLIALGRNLDAGEPHPSRYVGTGMHGGMILIRGEIATTYLGKEVGIVPLSDDDQWLLRRYVGEYAEHFGTDAAELLAGDFKKLIPHTKRPYGQLYAY